MKTKTRIKVLVDNYVKAEEQHKTYLAVQKKEIRKLLEKLSETNPKEYLEVMQGTPFKISGGFSGVNV